MTAASAMVPGAAMAALKVISRKPRALSFYNLHTGESLKTVYYENGKYLPEALAQVNYILRDFRQNEIKPIDPKLLDLLAGIHNRLDIDAPFDVISGYRSPKTNAMLHAHSEGVAAHSLHIDGKAIDIRVPGRDLSTLHRVAISMFGGGVGYYPRSDFVHVDTGRIRYWGR
ncbi:MAG TPA: YcbK family protein [Candidatus Binataceae bacterium]|nr:YcbK family protein [Candidatus Binataceae bacterium]